MFYIHILISYTNIINKLQISSTHCPLLVLVFSAISPSFPSTFATFPFTTFFPSIPVPPSLYLSFSRFYSPTYSSRETLSSRTAATRLMTIFNRASRAAIHNPALPRHISTGNRPGSPLSSESADTLHPLSTFRVGGPPISSRFDPPSIFYILSLSYSNEFFFFLFFKAWIVSPVILQR